MATISKTIKIDGDVFGAEDLEVQGRIEGTVDLPEHRVVVTAGASVEGDLRVASVEIRGEFNGQIVASKVAQLGHTANARGSILAPQIVMADGAAFKGVVETTDTPGDKTERRSGEK